MAKLIDEISVFLPAYNEEDNLDKVIRNTKDVLEKVAEKWELTIINDGSGDATSRVAESLTKTDSRIKVINHEVNKGYGATLSSGFYSAKYKWITFIDSDGQFDFSEITTLIQRQNQTKADVIVGYYLSRKVSFSRKINTFFWQLVVNLLFDLHLRDIDCGFKLFRKKVIETIPQLESERGAFISSEFLIKAQNQGFQIVEIGVHHFPRKEGVATGAKLNVIVKSFIDLFRLWKKLR